MASLENMFKRVSALIERGSSPKDALEKTTASKDEDDEEEKRQKGKRLLDPKKVKAFQGSFS